MHYLSLKDELEQLDHSVNKGNKDHNLAKIKDTLIKFKDEAYGPDMLYLARSANSVKEICIPYNISCLSEFIQIPGQVLVLLLTYPWVCWVV